METKFIKKSDWKRKIEEYKFLSDKWKEYIKMAVEYYVKDAIEERRMKTVPFFEFNSHNDEFCGYDEGPYKFKNILQSLRFETKQNNWLITYDMIKDYIEEISNLNVFIIRDHSNSSTMTRYNMCLSCE